jgi:hypothetical protein
MCVSMDRAMGHGCLSHKCVMGASLVSHVCPTQRKHAVSNRTRIYLCETASGHESKKQCGMAYIWPCRGAFPEHPRVVLGNAPRNTTGVMSDASAGPTQRLIARNRCVHCPGICLDIGEPRNAQGSPGPLHCPGICLDIG